MITHNRTERGSAGSISIITPVNGVDPALPRSVLCDARCYISWSLSKPEVLRSLRGTGSLVRGSVDRRFVVPSVTEAGAGGRAAVVTLFMAAGLRVRCSCQAP